MKWIKEDKSKVTKFERNYGDKKIKSIFVYCLKHTMIQPRVAQFITG